MDVKEIQGRVQQLKRSHNECDDTWYSCPKSEGGCSDDRQDDSCTCGADEHNKRIDEIIAVLATFDPEAIKRACADAIVKYIEKTYESINRDAIYAAILSSSPAEAEPAQDEGKPEDNYTYLDRISMGTCTCQQEGDICIPCTAGHALNEISDILKDRAAEVQRRLG